MTELEIIRKSNTIFSTMMCPICGKPLFFSQAGDTLLADCANHFYFYYDISELAALLNSNGINCIARKNNESNVFKKEVISL